jgi:hypothetical protein
MSPQAWIGVAGVVLTLAGLIIAIVRSAHTSGESFGELKRGVAELICRDDRLNGRLDTFEVRLNDLTGRVGRLEGRDE